MDTHHLLFFFFFFTTTTTAAATTSSFAELLRFCGGARTASPQSFDVNFVDTMELISQKISQTGFGIASSANSNSSQRVFGLGQCFHYLSNVDCRLCYSECRVKLPLCLPSTTARVYLDGCFLTYGDHNFSQQPLDPRSDKALCGSPTPVCTIRGGGERVGGEFDVAAAAAYGERGYYMEGKVVVGGGVEVYGVAQCWRSLNKSGCRECLESARKSVVGCLPSSEGRALNVGCYVRYSTEPFYVVSQLRGDSKYARHRLVIALGSIFAAVVVIGGAIIWGIKGTAKSTDDGGILSDEREIAVKRLFVNTNQWLEQFFNEVNLISRVQHKNLVKLFGCSVDGPESLLVYEYLSNTSLDKFLFDSIRKAALNWRRRFDIVVGTAEGLAYLHESSEIRIIHRDIKASNILLDQRFKPKISDFGLARYFAEDQSHLSTGLAGTLGYMAPEYAVHGQLTEKADIYSYGILVLEVVTGCRNTRSAATLSGGHSLISKTWEHFNAKTLNEMLDSNLKGQCSEEQVVRVLTVGLLCTQASPNLRPPMWKVVEMLTSTAAELPIPTRPPYINIKSVDYSSDCSRTTYMYSSSSKSPVSVNEMSLSIMRGR
ncbi:hypothetical protein Scep_030818 [Stephania cephalantha]|uniref:Cysteine-rich receptor-like protein kinase 42 n=1 Tax=Stephania cephalantha TaxID=152367 RepID=A0AAP0E4V5_9MAGN